jgi:hypothetical protein
MILCYKMFSNQIYSFCVLSCLNIQSVRHPLLKAPQQAPFADGDKTSFTFTGNVLIIVLCLSYV